MLGRLPGPTSSGGLLFYRCAVLIRTARSSPTAEATSCGKVGRCQKLFGSPPRRSQRKGGFSCPLYAAAPRLQDPPSPRIPEPALRFLHPSLPPSLLHLALNRTGWKTRAPASKTAQGAFLPLGGILSGFFAPARRFLDAISGVSCPLVLCRFRH